MTAVMVYRPEIGPPVYGWDSAVSYGSQIYPGDKRMIVGSLTLFLSGHASASAWVRSSPDRPQRQDEDAATYLHVLGRALGRAMREGGQVESCCGLAIAADCAWYWDTTGDVREILRGSVEGIGSSHALEAAWHARSGIDETAEARVLACLQAAALVLPGAVCGPMYVMVER